MVRRRRRRIWWSSGRVRTASRAAQGARGDRDSATGCSRGRLRRHANSDGRPTALATGRDRCHRDVGVRDRAIGPAEVPIGAGRRAPSAERMRSAAGNVADGTPFSIRVHSTQPKPGRAPFYGPRRHYFIEATIRPASPPSTSGPRRRHRGAWCRNGPSHDTYFLISKCNATPLRKALSCARTAAARHTRTVDRSAATT